MRFVTLFLKTENVHLLKDVGMIPYHLYKDHDLDCSVACYKNSEEYTYADNEVKGLKIDLSSYRNAIINANKKRGEYASAKEEIEQMKKLGINN